MKINISVLALLLVIALGSCTTVITQVETAFSDQDPDNSQTESDHSDQDPVKTLDASKPSFSHIVVDAQGPDGLWLKSVGDVNGDGKIDLIAGGNLDGGLVWYENPEWKKNLIDSGNGFSTDAEVADVDLDGDNDILAITQYEIRWYENPEWTMHKIAVETVHDIEVADFDQDGDIDIVGRNQGEWGMQGDELHFYQQGSSQSWEHKSIPVKDGEGLKVADIDRDNDQDVIINGSWYENSGDILEGSWNETVFSSEWNHPNSTIDVGDLNGDGYLDIALAPSELAGDTYRISWFEAPADARAPGWIEHIVQDNVESVIHFIGIADLDNDGDMDLASAEMDQGEDPDDISVYINTDSSGQTWSREVIATTGSHSMRIIDIDGDNDMDLYGANWQSQQPDLFVNSTCPASLEKWQRYVIDSERPWTSIFISSDDVDGDGYNDIVTGGWWYQNPGDPGGNWSRMAIGSPLNNMAAVFDIDDDGDIDVLGTEGEGADYNSSFVWARNDGTGTFDIKDNIQEGDGDFLQGVAVGETVNEGNPGAALSWHGYGMGIQMLELPPDPVNDLWLWKKISATSQDEAINAGDIDRDGDSDLLLGTIWLENLGDTWAEHLLHDTADAPYGESDPDRNRLVDINNDGKLDAVVGYEAISTEGKLAWYEQGEIPTAPWTEHMIAFLVGPMSLDVADMDGDQDLDVIVGEHNLDNPSDAKLYIFENINNQQNEWHKHVVSVGDEHHDGARVVDIDNDGDLDIISIGWGHDNVLLYENTSTNCSNVIDPGSLEN